MACQPKHFGRQCTNCLKVLKISQTELSLKTNSVQKSGGSYEDVQAHSMRCLVDAATLQSACFLNRNF